jgi:IS30 family transposase
MVNQRLLEELLGITKSAFSPPPAEDINQLVQVVMEGLQQGLQPDQVAGSLQQRGVPPEAIQQAFSIIQQQQGGQAPPPDMQQQDMQQQAPPQGMPAPQEAPPSAPPMDAVDQRLGVVEQKVELLINLVEDLLNKEDIAKDQLQSVKEI